MHLNIAVLDNVWFIRGVLIQALTCCVTEREEQRRRGRERRAPDKSTKLRVRSVFLHQRNEWHNEATPPNVREPSVALPEGLCRRQKGETREEGGHVLEGSLQKTSCLIFLLK